MSERFDKILKAILIQAESVTPSFTYSFGVSYHAKDSLYQLTLSRDYAHRDGPMVFLTGIGNSTELAAEDLGKKFVGWCLDQSYKIFEEMNKAQVKSRSDSLRFSTASLNLNEILNETVADD